MKLQTKDFMVCVWNRTDEHYNETFVIINEVKYWKETGYLRDGWKEDEWKFLDPYFMEVNLAEAMDGHYELDDGSEEMTIEQANIIKDKLVEKGFIYDEQFEIKMNKD